jgi:CubicO group peptidase (beta-lactamase class C family)
MALLRLAGAADTPKFGGLTFQPISTNDFENISTFVEGLRSKEDFPGVAVAVVSAEKLLAAGAAGVRKLGDPERITLEDKFHIGSCTKAMTALLAASFMREGKLQTNTTVGDVFRDWELSDQVKGITLADLLAHRSGIPYIPSDALWQDAFGLKGSGREQRVAFLKKALAEPLEAKPGEKYIYSNTGYSLAGAMLEKIGDRDWEDLMRDRIFRPLGLQTAGFGPPAAPDKIDQPWGHQWQKGKPQWVDRFDNPDAIGPAGKVHLSILDLSRYAAFQLNAIKGKVPEIDEKLRAMLYLPYPGGEYAAGWIVVDRPWAGGTAYTHAGCNTMFYTLIWLVPARNRAFLVCVNIGDRNGETPTDEACDRTVSALIKKFL